jgi:hypothetical protein
VAWGRRLRCSGCIIAAPRQHALQGMWPVATHGTATTRVCGWWVRRLWRAGSGSWRGQRAWSCAQPLADAPPRGPGARHREAVPDGGCEASRLALPASAAQRTQGLNALAVFLYTQYRRLCAVRRLAWRSMPYPTWRTRPALQRPQPAPLLNHTRQAHVLNTHSLDRTQGFSAVTSGWRRGGRKLAELANSVAPGPSAAGLAGGVLSGNGPWAALSGQGRRLPGWSGQVRGRRVGLQS